MIRKRMKKSPAEPIRKYGVELNDRRNTIILTNRKKRVDHWLKRSDGLGKEFVPVYEN